MICKLCLEEKPLIKKSHIIPQFMYKRILEDDGYFYKVNKESLKNYTEGKSLREYILGEYESDILCSNCENEILNKRYGDYAAKVYQLLDGDIETFGEIDITSYKNDADMSGKKIKNIQYGPFKLFLLSILWKASIAKRSLFRKVSLGKQHEEIIRGMLYNNDPRDTFDYPCFICDLSIDAPELKSALGMPKKLKKGSNTSYYFLIAGMLYMISISKYKRKPIAQKGVINQNNEMIIWDSPEGFGKYNAGIISRDFQRAKN